ncbi:zf-HC2 domain-containing protein [Methylotenera sp.]|uniref:anti-sigma factor family protein n=1 Tax=Methylotenera sp. TaxID=2051956 RepID=UPI0027373DAF|nr:zf-HC2 domain-containing protein [Methylotenera sp.]MDP3004668.1 zf-HC2 domain-containing protein [Methylotenera sp.]
MHTSTNVFKRQFILTCKQAAPLASRSLDESLTLHEQLLLKWHLLICQSCTTYFGQIKLIRKIIRDKRVSTMGLSDEARKRIAQVLSDSEAAITLNNSNQ